MPEPPLKEYAGNVPPGKRPFTANIDRGLHERMRVGSALLGSNMGQIVEILIDAYMPVTVDGVPEWPDKRRRELVKWLEGHREGEPFAHWLDN